MFDDENGGGPSKILALISLLIKSLGAAGAIFVLISSFIYRDRIEAFADRYVFDHLADWQSLFVSGLVLGVVFLFNLFEYLRDDEKKNIYLYQLPYTSILIFFLVALFVADHFCIIQPDPK